MILIVAVVKNVSQKKSKDINLKLYGVKNPMQYSEFREKSLSKQRTPFGEVKKIFDERSMTILSDEDEYKNRDTLLKSVCKKHSNKVQYLSFKKVLKNSTPCEFCREENDFANINHRLRSCINEWKILTEEKCNYSCVITNSKSYDIHHLKSFKDIVKEAFINLNYTVENYNEVTFEEIKNEVKRLHFFYGLGVCIDKSLHKDFHSKYGYDFNNSDFLEFIDSLNKTRPVHREICVGHNFNCR